MLKRAAQSVAGLQTSHLALLLQVIIPSPPAWELEHDEWQEEVQRRHFRTLPESWADYDKAKSSDASAGRGWEPGPRITEQDKQKDIQSLNRCLDQRLYFVVRSQGAPWAVLKHHQLACLHAAWLSSRLSICLLANTYVCSHSMPTHAADAGTSAQHGTCRPRLLTHTSSHDRDRLCRSAVELSPAAP